MRRFVALLGTFFAVFSTVLVGYTTPVTADVVAPFTPIFDQVIHGDYILAGNSVTQCPTAASTNPKPVDVSKCANAAKHVGSTEWKEGANSSYFMEWADVDNDPSTYNSSSVQMTIPAGAKVAYAHMSWAGALGQNQDFKSDDDPSPTFSDKACGYLGLFDPPLGGPSSFPPIAPPGTPDSQTVKLTVGDNAPLSLAPGQFEHSTEPAANVDPVGHVAPYYSADADVTSAFANASSGSPLAITAANVWAPQGFNCFGGWALQVVYDFGKQTDAPESAPRHVWLYDGHARQFYTDDPTTIDVQGFTLPSDSKLRLGVVAYEGDWAVPGDTLLVNGVPAQDTFTGPADEKNFFKGYADGQLSPNNPNNMSVDAKSVEVTLGGAGGGGGDARNARRAAAADTGLTLTIHTEPFGDNFMVQNLAISASAHGGGGALVTTGAPVAPIALTGFVFAAIGAGLLASHRKRSA